MRTIERAAVIGGGLIGASWAALFLSRGIRVALFDPADPEGFAVCGYIAKAWPALQELGLADNADPEAITSHTSAAAAVDGADFVQESVPERLEVKHQVFAEIEPALPADAIVASSASGLTLSEMQKGWRDPTRLILGHPFNPPHLIPLVELMSNECTAPGVVERAEAIYSELGKVTIRVRREVPGHVANRLQAALWREAIHLVTSGVTTVEDVDKAVWAGPGLRWAAMGPTMLFNLGAGPGGLAEFCARYADSFHRWWDDLGDPRLDMRTACVLVEGASAAMAGRSIEALSADRDALLLAIINASRIIREAQAEREGSHSDRPA
jgi:carnitine 3-dehydrogenase